MTTFIALLVAGCAGQQMRTGLVLEEQEKILLVGSEGSIDRLNLTGESVALARALGCRVEVKGRPSLGRLVVADWKIVDSGYGSEPFVGRLHTTGSAWRIQDRNSGTWVELVPESMGKLKGFEGAMVLVGGFVLGPNLVKVVSFRILMEN